MSYQTEFTQPLKFLGAYVTNATLSMGWGSESGYCNLELVEEPDEGVLFDPPSLGTACMFTAGKLNFGGVLKKYDYKVSAGEGRRYNVTLESPGAILNGVYLVLSRFQGTIYTDDTNIDNPTLKPLMTYGGKYPTNIINVYAHKENITKGGKFGAADLNELGYPVKGIIADIKDTMSGSRGFGGKIVYSGTEYDLDLSELQAAIDLIPGYRIPGDFITINDLIGKITEMALYDFTYTITGTPSSKGVLTSTGKPTIKVKALSRRTPPTPNAIKGIIDNYNSQSDKNVISYSIGKEIPDVTTQQVLIGGQASRYWLANRNYILPVWGSLGQGQTATYFYGNSLAEYGNIFAPVRVTIDGGGQYGEGNYTYVDTNLLELRCALNDNRDAWTAYHILTAIRDGVDGVTFGNFSITQNDFTKLLQGNLAPNDLLDTSLTHAQMLASYMYGMEPMEDSETYAQRVVNARWNCVKKAAEQFYGHEFLVAIPGEPGGVANNYRWISFDQKYESAWEIDSSAWAGDNAKSNFPDLSFYDTNGRLEAIAIYPNYDNADYSQLGNQYGRCPSFGTNYGVVTKANVDTNWGIRWIDVNALATDSNGNIKKDSAGNAITTTATYGFVKVRLDSKVTIYDQYTSNYNGFNVLCNLIFGTNMLPGYHNMFGFENLDFALPPSPVAPEYIGIPQKSNRYVWGPWYSIGSTNGQKGKVSIENDANMNPESFGSISALNQAASTFVNAELVQIAESETGFLELAELPQYGLADKFFGEGPYITSMGISVSANGFNTTYNFQNWTKKFAQFARYNIDQFTKGRSHIFQFQKQLRDLFRNPVPPPINLTAKEPKMPKINPVVNNMIAGNFINGLAYAINNPNDSDPDLSIQSGSAQGAMRSMGMNYMESFGASMEQIYTPVFLYDQRKPEQVKRAFNEGNL